MVSSALCHLIGVLAIHLLHCIANLVSLAFGLFFIVLTLFRFFQGYVYIGFVIIVSFRSPCKGCSLVGLCFLPLLGFFLNLLLDRRSEGDTELAVELGVDFIESLLFRFR